ncbi:MULTISPECIES: hypothetical protein [Ralstonia solanacearum species complex]|uniref:Oxidoreductase n=1 Tax=Ralstonia solanacearum K60 TaxID=1091042 RepID=A0AAP7ZHX6_RALSL|nr:hypothetical protein [Ralstonia solanacearum]OKA44179.1 hypothetical protein BH759_13860 [Ralstonia solanacearum]OYQ09409.1 hypothetical protein B7R77_21020 [Ralstonia solanacearum K60]
MTFQALLASKAGDKISTSVVSLSEQDLMPGDVVVAVDYSSVNYKDALAITAWSRLARELDLGKPARTTHVVGLAGVPAVIERLFEEQVQGRTVVDVSA